MQLSARVKPDRPGANSPAACGIPFVYAFPSRPFSESLAKPLRPVGAGAYCRMWRHFTAQDRDQQSGLFSHAHGFTHTDWKSNANPHPYSNPRRHGSSGSVAIPVYG
jgi:hypothetical protein